MKKGSKKKSSKALVAVSSDSGEIAARQKHVASFALKDWLAHIDDHAKKMELAGNPKGACLISDPQTGGNNCVLTDQATCTKMGGTWIGGPCGAD